ncbi:MAG TPA: hypothetical protein PKD15_00725 [Candidatus Saccharibacteria bacterium]|nr:hypothetical protein [Candidatus Saccharibacteria bacterium]
MSNERKPEQFRVLSQLEETFSNAGVVARVRTTEITTEHHTLYCSTYRKSLFGRQKQGLPMAH